MIDLQLPWLEVFSGIAGISLLGALFPKRKPDSPEARMRFLEEKYGEFKEDFPELKDITVEQFLDLRDKEKFVLIDVRAPEEREISIIPGAITPEVFEENQNQYEGHTAVTYCTAGYRSGKFAQKLEERNLPVRNLMGGVIAWALAGQKFQDSGGDCKRVHVFNKTWNILSEEYEAVW